MTGPQLLREYLKAMREEDVMSCALEVPGQFKLQVVLGARFESHARDEEPAPGGWKTEVSDPLDPDPLGLGPLDAPVDEVPA